MVPNYGALKKPDAATIQVLPPLMWCVLFVVAWFVPAANFVEIIYIRSTGFAYNLVSIILCVGIWVVNLILLLTTFHRQSRTDFRKLTLLMTFVGGIVAFALGTSIFKDDFEPYNDITSLTNYPMVDTSAYTGQQMMDAGQIEFVPGSHLDLSKSYGFKNGHTYCVAPIVAPEFRGPEQNRDNYDFWAVGLDCCSGHTNDFHCGEFANPNARKGLRLMRDFDRNFYRLAVKEAKASYGLTANYPIFMTWMESPEREVQAHYDDGVFNSFSSCVAFCLIHFMLLLFVSWATYIADGDAKEPRTGKAVTFGV